MVVPRPPKKLMRVGNPEHWDWVGAEFTVHLRNLCDLAPADDVLDIGCGVGRIAAPLTRILTGRYEGFDVNRDGIKWCRKNITRRHPNFGFQYVDLHNGRYNPKGKVDPNEFTFPYPDDSFDVAFATSVFTHMTAPSVKRYLTELRRVLRRRALLTFYLWTEDSRRSLQEDSEGRPTFEHDRGDYRVHNPDTEEDVVAYDDEMLVKMLGEAGLTLEGVHPGRWSGQEGISWQDIVIVS